MTKLAWIFAIVLIIVGILGFVPGVTSNGMLLGVFSVDAMHNIVHLITGVVFLITALKSASATKTAFKVFGIIYAIVTVVGFIQGDSVLGLMMVNTADNVLHLVIAVVALWAGYKKEGGAAPAAAAPTM